MRHLFAVAVFAIALPAVAVDQDSFQLATGADLAKVCMASADHALQPNALGLCHGFLEGAYQFYDATEPTSRRSVCSPNPAPTRTAVMQGFVTWADSHPQYLQEGAVHTLFRYLDETYPCSQ
jgi:hypothetical protein